LVAHSVGNRLFPRDCAGWRKYHQRYFGAEGEI
jgi:hypothetical protein